MEGKDSLKEWPVITNSCSKAMKASWSSDQSVILILICPGWLSPIQPAITWTWIFAHWAPNSAGLWELSCNGTGHSLETPCIHFNCPPQTFTTTVRHSVWRLGIARSAGTGSLDGRAAVVLGGPWTLGWVYRLPKKKTPAIKHMDCVTT